jgi:hypothetical protein
MPGAESGLWRKCCQRHVCWKGAGQLLHSRLRHRTLTASRDAHTTAGTVVGRAKTSLCRVVLQCLDSAILIVCSLVLNLLSPCIPRAFTPASVVLFADACASQIGEQIYTCMRVLHRSVSTTIFGALGMDTLKCPPRDVSRFFHTSRTYFWVSRRQNPQGRHCERFKGFSETNLVFRLSDVHAQLTQSMGRCAQ